MFAALTFKLLILSATVGWAAPGEQSNRGFDEFSAFGQANKLCWMQHPRRCCSHKNHPLKPFLIIRERQLHQIRIGMARMDNGSSNIPLSLYDSIVRVRFYVAWKWKLISAGFFCPFVACVSSLQRRLASSEACLLHIDRPTPL